MTVDIKNLSVEELITLESSINAEIEKKRREGRNEAKRKIMEIAKEAGLEIHFGIGSGGDKKTKEVKKAAIKYQNPVNAEQTWTGRGRTPTWLVAEMNSGKKLEDFAI